MNKLLKRQIASLPQKPGVYIFKNKLAEVLYVGKAVNLRARVNSHFNQKTAPFLDKIREIDFIKTRDEKDALILENQLIKKYQPRYNVEWRDDKDYFWVGITKERYPRVFLVHQRKTKNKKEKIKNTNKRSKNSEIKYFGPYVDGQELKSFLRQIRKIVPYRTCRTLAKRPCLYYDLGLCLGYCLQKRSVKNYALLKELLKIYLGKSGRLEAYDISNIQGTLATGSMVAFENNRPSKAQYRRFKIKTIKGANDVAMLQEIIWRRLKHKEWPQPNLIMIDGGRAQINAARKLLGATPTLKNNNCGVKIPLVALAKKEEELFTVFSNKSLRLEKLPADFSNVLLYLRDEAHRFGISYHKKLRQKALRIYG